MYFSFELKEIPRITAFYSVTRNTVWEIADKDNILIFITDGMCEISLDGETNIAEKGDIVFIPQNHSYTRRPVDSTLCTMTYIHFSIDTEIVQSSKKNLVNDIAKIKDAIDSERLVGDRVTSYPQTVYLQTFNQDKGCIELHKRLKDINIFSTRRQITCHLQSSAALCTILIGLSQLSIDALQNDFSLEDVVKIPYNLKKAVSYIHRNYFRPISLGELSAYCNVSKQQMTRYFKDAFHTTPINYVIEFRISKSKDLLFNHPELSINEISTELGFDNQHYFARLFKKITGETPSEYRYRTVNYPKVKKRQ